MSWIESHQSLDFHPKTRRAAKLLSVSVPAIIGHLHILWHWALDYAPDGDLSGLSADEIADGAMWEDDPESFVAALTDCGVGDHAGFIESTNDGLVLHDWHDYAGKLVEKRQADAARKRDARKTTDGEGEDVPGTSNGHPEDVLRTSPNLTLPTLIAERAREELNALQSIPGYPFDYAKDLEHLQRLCVDFPKVDLLHEIGRWATWIADNRKPKNWRLSLRNWIEKAKPSLRVQHPAKPPDENDAAMAAFARQNELLREQEERARAGMQ